MKVYTAISHEGMTAGTDRVVLLLRRVGAAVGFLFGFGLLALMMASNASAEGSQQDGDGRPHAGQSLLGSVTGTVSNVLSPVTETVTEPVGQVLEPAAPLVAAVSDSVAPVADVVEPITELVVAPVLAPVVDIVTPVLDAVAPVTEPLVGPLLHAVDPVVEPVTDAIGVDDEVSPVAETVTGERHGQQAITDPQGQSSPPFQPAISWVDDAAAATAPERTVEHAVQWDSSRVDEASVTVAAVTPGGSGQPGQTPVVPVGPAGVAPGGSGSLAGTGGAHAADAALSTPSGLLTNNDGSGRSPPGAIDGLPWIGYAQPDCPS